MLTDFFYHGSTNKRGTQPKKQRDSAIHSLSPQRMAPANPSGPNGVEANKSEKDLKNTSFKRQTSNGRMKPSQPVKRPGMYFTTGKEQPFVSAKNTSQTHKKKPDT
jgi:hypothetical protein